MNAPLPKFETVPTVRRVIHSTRGRRHGPITRLVSPSDIGGLTKPFVFLDYFEADPANAPAFGFHPHSGIATLTLLLDGRMSYEESTGAKGVIEPGGVEWMRAGGGVWHTGGAVGTAPIKGFQLWISLPPDLENGPAQSQYLGADAFQSLGPARVILGRHGNAVSRIAAPETMTYLDVRLKAGEHWCYQPRAGHTTAWIAVHQGSVNQGAVTPDAATQGAVRAGAVAVFDPSDAALDFTADGDTAFILGTAMPHPHDLVLGRYSVHTNEAALAQGEARIMEIGRQLHADGRLG